MRWIDGRTGSRAAGRAVAFAHAVFFAGLSVGCGVALGACGTAREQGASDRNAATATAASGAATLPASPAADAGLDPDAADAGPDPDAGGAAAASEVPAAAPGPARTGPLARFHAALDGLANHTRKEHVRVLWLGDSHGQADFWTGRVRTILQKRFGSGGPGFVHIAYKGYRHDGVDLQSKDKWVTRPKGPATGLSTFDGVFGLGGLLTSTDVAGADAGVEIRDGSLPKKLHWDLCYRFNKPGESIRVSLTGQKPMTLTAGAKIGAKPPLLHTRLTTTWDGPPKQASNPDPKQATSKAPPKGPRLEVAPASGIPFFCGVVIETDPVESPGVVLDSLGINGARFTTALAWDEEAWLAELARRSPALVIFEYGTNESGDVGIKAETYAEKVTRLVARIRKNKPEADCAVLAPTERADQELRSALIRDIWKDAAQEAGCWFWDTLEVMGGKGGMRAWRAQNPPKGAKDGVHLTVRGYQELGDRLAADLLKKY